MSEFPYEKLCSFKRKYVQIQMKTFHFKKLEKLYDFVACKRHSISLSKGNFCIPYFCTPFKPDSHHGPSGGYGGFLGLIFGTVTFLSSTLDTRQSQ